MISDAARERFDEFLATATNIFMTRGYRRAKMADVTGALGLSEGAIYRYFETKDALFYVVMRAASDPTTPVEVDSLPIPTPATGQTLECLRAAIEDRTRFESLRRALENPAGAEAVAGELAAIVREIHQTSVRFRVGLRLIERCAMDWPELQDLWFGGHRRQLEGQLVVYLQDRIDRGWLRVGPGPQIIARIILELVGYFAMHRHQHPLPMPLDEQVAEDALVDNIVNAYCPASG